MDLTTLKENIYDNLLKVHVRMKELEAKTATGLLTASAIWPIIAAAQNGDMQTIKAFWQLSGSLGVNMLASRIDAWEQSVTSESQAVATIEEEMDANPDLRAEMAAFVEKLDVITEALKRQSEQDRTWLEEVLRKEWTQRGKGEQIETLIQISVKENTGTVIGKQENVTNNIATQIINKGTSEEEKAAKAQEEAQRHYLKELRDDCRFLPLGAQGAKTGSEEDITLEHVYINLTTTSRAETSRKEEKVDDVPITALEAFEKNKRLVLLGDPGSGKSTFVNHILALYADALLAPHPKPPAGLPVGLVPVKIVLRDLAASLRTAYPEGIPANTPSNKLAHLVRNRAIQNLDLYDAHSFEESFRKAFSQNNLFMVLDGLDEVPGDQRGDIRRVVKALVKHCAVQYLIVTCRIRSYQDEESEIPDSEKCTLASFDNEQRKAFAKAWYNTPAARKLIKEKGNRDNKAENLGQLATEDLASIAGNPMLLTTMAIIHQRGTGLPDKRVELYAVMLDVMLWKWQEVKSGDHIPISKEFGALLKEKHLVLRALMHLAYDAHAELSSDASFAGISRGNAITLLERPEYLEKPAMADAFLDYVDQRSGLLQGYGGSGKGTQPLSYGFPHRTIQEYLAGLYISSHLQGDLLEKLAEQGEFWSEAVKLGFEEQVYNGNQVQVLLNTAYLNLPPKFPEAPHKQRLILWMGYLAHLVKAPVIEADKTPAGGKVFLGRLKDHLVKVMGGALPAIERAEADRILGRIGDPREALTTIDNMTFCYVPAGPFQLGMDDGEKEWGEIPERTESIPYKYWIGQYPVTQGQYRKFIDAGGYTKKVYWTNAGWQAKEEGKWAGPVKLDDAFMLANHPVVGISWYEAYAFTQWLNEYAVEHSLLPSGYEIALPRELEWEKAARGGHHVPEQAAISRLNQVLNPVELEFRKNDEPGRAYTYGNEADANKMNCLQTGIGRTTSPGCYEEANNPHGAVDMNGNVWEWCTDIWSKKPPDSSSLEEVLLETENSPSRVLRGGSFDNNASNCRCASRYFDNPDSRLYYIGFRLVVRPMTSESLNSEKAKK